MCVSTLDRNQTVRRLLNRETVRSGTIFISPGNFCLVINLYHSGSLGEINRCQIGSISVLFFFLFFFCFVFFLLFFSSKNKGMALFS